MVIKILIELNIRLLINSLYRW